VQCPFAIAAFAASRLLPTTFGTAHFFGLGFGFGGGGVGLGDPTVIEIVAMLES
jgi:hypothetical protein